MNAVAPRRTISRFRSGRFWQAGRRKRFYTQANGPVGEEACCRLKVTRHHLGGSPVFCPSESRTTTFLSTPPSASASASAAGSASERLAAAALVDAREPNKGFNKDVSALMSHAGLFGVTMNAQRTRLLVHVQAVDEAEEETRTAAVVRYSEGCFLCAR